MTSEYTADVVIIGGGIVGTAIAYELSKYQVAVILIEQDPDLATGTTKANSGILHAGFDPEPGSLKALTNARGNQIYHELEEDLHFEIRWTGSLVVAKTEEEIHTLHELLERGRKNNVPGMRILYGEEVFEREPNLSREIKAALYAPTAGVICPFTAAISFAECAVQNGAKVLLDCKAESFEFTDDRISTVNTNKGKIKTKYVINAAGIDADSVSRLAKDESYSITPRRGEYLLFDSSVSAKLVDSIVFPTPGKLGKGTLVCSTYHEEVFIGPSTENIHDKTDTATTAEGMHLVIQKARQIVPDIPLNAVITEFSGLRAISDTDDFIIKTSACSKGLVHAAGIQSPGLTSAPAIAELIVQELAKTGLSLVKKENFNPRLPKKVKFKKLSDAEKADLIATNPLYGRIICRCETVSEGEIVDAINSICGARTVDAVKRRVRAGLGRCQGGFCMPRVTAILARELNLELTDIVKETADSKLFFPKHADERI